MIVLSAIGRFFKKIWDWIKQTAWIQPLLIVGLIFGVIFSIPSIVNAIKNAKTESSTYAAYYHHYKLSLTNEAESEADKFTYSLQKAIEGDTTEFNNNYADRCGDKFFMAFVGKTCPNCEEAKDGFATFDKYFNNTEYYMSKVDHKEKFRLVTIFTDDENEDTTDNQTAFGAYLNRHQKFFEDAASNIYVTPYYESQKIKASALDSFACADVTDFYSPTILLVELGQKAADNGQYVDGVTELMFGIEGTDQNSRAKTLLNCWNHTGDFSSTVQPK